VPDEHPAPQRQLAVPGRNLLLRGHRGRNIEVESGSSVPGCSGGASASTSGRPFPAQPFRRSPFRRSPFRRSPGRRRQQQQREDKP